MWRIGRHRIAFGRTCWFQSQLPFTARRFLCFWIIREARPTDSDEEMKFLPGTPMEYEGRRYRYFGPAPRDMERGEAVFGLQYPVTPESAPVETEE